MSIISVFRDGSTWRYSIKGVTSPERFETRDDAKFEAERAIVAAQKEQVERDKAEKAKAKFKKDDETE